MSDAAPGGKPHKRISIARIIMNDDGSIEYEGDSAAIAEAVEHSVRARARQERKSKAWGKIGPEAMTRLAMLFPSLREAPGVDPWTGGDSDDFLRWATSGVLSHGEVLAAKFVLSVWNSSTDWEEAARDRKLITEPDHHFTRFDLFEAMSVWDQEHISAMQAWIELPFFP